MMKAAGFKGLIWVRSRSSAGVVDGGSSGQPGDRRRI